MDGNSLRDRVCLVTGSTRGIGRAVAEILLEQGASVLGVGRTTESRDRLAVELSGYGEAFHAAAQDLSEPDAGEALVAAAVRRWGRLDLVVNNAASFAHKPGAVPTREEWLDLFILKVLGYRAVIVAAVPELTKVAGAIVNIAGTAGITPSPDAPHVGAVNAAVISMSESYAALLAGTGVRVNVITPGAVDTDRFRVRVEAYAQAHGLPLEEVRATFAENIPVGFPADPRAIAEMVVALSLPHFGSLTGAHLVFDGGGTLSGRRRL